MVRIFCVLMLCGALVGIAQADAGFALVSPVGGESWSAGSVQVIQWWRGAHSPKVWEIWSSTDGGKSFPTKLGELTPEEQTDTLSWKWMDVGPIGKELRIKVVAVPTTKRGVAVYAQSPADFSIIEPAAQPGETEKAIAPTPGNSPEAAHILPMLVLTAPNGGEKFTVGDPIDITWEDADQTAVYELYLSTDNGKTFEPILLQDPKRRGDRALDAATASYRWIVDAKPSKQCRMKVVALHNRDVIAEDVSNAAFEIRISKRATKAEPIK